MTREDEDQLVVGRPGKSISEGGITVATLMVDGMLREEAVETLKQRLGLTSSVPSESEDESEEDDLEDDESEDEFDDDEF